MKTIKKIIEPTNQPSPIAPLKKKTELGIIDVALLFCISIKEIYISVGINFYPIS